MSRNECLVKICASENDHNKADITHRTRTGWMKWRVAPSMLWVESMLPNLNGKLCGNYKANCFLWESIKLL